MNDGMNKVLMKSSEKKGRRMEEGKKKGGKEAKKNACVPTHIHAIMM